MAVVILGEPFAAYHVVALILVVTGIAIAQRGRAAVSTESTRKGGDGDGLD
jgi:drug/metabolite transporter (DMT)-like permease